MIDFYGFYGPWPYWNSPHTAPSRMLQLMAKNGIEQAVICHTGAIFDDWDKANNEALAAAQADHRLIPFVCLNPVISGEQMVAVMKTYKQRGCRGIRLYPQHHHYRLSEPVAETMLATAEQLGLPVVLSVRIIMQWGLPTLDTGEISAAVRKFPKVQFVLSGTNYGESRWLYELMDSAPNVSAEISAMEGFRAVQEVVARFGAKRILFGAGTPLQYPACNVAKMNVTQLSADDREAIASGNARRLMGLL
ncbi:MAG TPA: amidohydrolase family protein [Terracidiphilus sp.]|jgi:predicted TIM-barrel fold metal-dependent hydrolase|nr:amidohydrolase family protein [Terracidiphilus sp.]